MRQKKSSLGGNDGPRYLHQWHVRSAMRQKKAHLAAMMDRTLASSAFPCAVLPPTGQKPLIFSSFRAFCVASIHFFRGLLANAFFAFAEAPLLTTLPLLFLRSELFVKPPTVF